MRLPAPGRVIESIGAATEWKPQLTESWLELLEDRSRGAGWLVSQYNRLLHAGRDLVSGPELLERIPLPDTGTQYNTDELVALATPRGPGKTPFDPFHDLSLFKSSDPPQPDRFKLGEYYIGDDWFLNQMARNFRSGAIDDTTLVVANTGHAPAISYAMAHRFKSGIFMNFNENAFGQDNSNYGDLCKIFAIESKARVLRQAQTFFKSMHDSVASGSPARSSFLLTVDAHQINPLNPGTVDRLPKGDTLRSLGVTKIFYGSETFPNAFGPRPFSGVGRKPFEGLNQWLFEMRDSGIKVVEDGLDKRSIRP